MIDDGDNDELSEFMLGCRHCMLALGHVVMLGDSWVTDFHHCWHSPSRPSSTRFLLVSFYDTQENADALFYNPQTAGEILTLGHVGCAFVNRNIRF